MTEEIDWTPATWEGTRRRQHRDFRALPFREKVRVLEQLDEVARALAAGRRRPPEDLPGTRSDPQS